jgi:glycosyltransferase involved in cell wall biosynthesis
VVPLQESPFNHAKSWLKALEFSSMGIPVVASASEDNRRLAKTVPILLAETEDEWRSHLTDLINDPDRRASIGAAAREAVRARNTFEDNAENWAAAWERALARKKRLTYA